MKITAVGNVDAHVSVPALVCRSGEKAGLGNIN
jgi:hypothetical protein